MQAAEDLLNATETRGVACNWRQRARTPDASESGARQISAQVMEEEYRRVLLDVMNAYQEAN